MHRPLAGLTRHNIAREALAGVTLLTISVPLNIGYAQIAGLEPVAGLYALVVPTLVYALTAGSRQVVASPDAAAAALVASSVGGLAVGAAAGSYAAMAMAQAILSGAMFLLLAFFRLGALARFLSKPILIGFVGGLALDILVSQIAKMLGIPLHAHEFVARVAGIVTGLGEVDAWSLIVSALSLTVLLVGRRLAPAVPWALVVLVGATLTVAAVPAAATVAVLGEVAGGAPPLGWPVLSWQTWLALVPSALALTLVTTAEGLLVSRAYAQRHGDPFDANRDLFAFGVGNIASGASGSFAIGSSTSRTAAMDQAGSRTQFPSIVLAAGALALLLFGTALLAGIPSPAIGAVVAVAVWRLLGLTELRELWRLDRREFAVAAACFAVTLFVGAIPGILVSFVLSLVLLAARAAQPAVDVLPLDGTPARSLVGRRTGGDAVPVTPTAPGILVVRLAAPLFFANGDVLADAVRRAIAAIAESDAEPVRHVVLDLEAVSGIDVTSAETLVTLRDDLEAGGVTLSYSRARRRLQERLRRLGVLTHEELFATNVLAVAALSEKDR
ncbi:SulP family inorganic anion transporter [Microbacterium aurum]